MKDTVIKFKASPAFAQQLKAIAVSEDRSVSELVRQVMHRYVDRKGLQGGHKGAIAKGPPMGHAVATNGTQAPIGIKQESPVFSLGSSRKEHSKNPGIKPLSVSDERHEPLRRLICDTWKLKNGSVAPWDGRTAKTLKTMLQSVPTWTMQDFAVCIANRFQSEANHADPPFAWIGKLPSYKAGPLDRFNRPLPEDVHAKIARVTSELSFSDGGELSKSEAAH